jgi:hypothetical protein
MIGRKPDRRLPIADEPTSALDVSSQTTLNRGTRGVVDVLSAITANPLRERTCTFVPRALRRLLRMLSAYNVRCCRLGWGDDTPG